MGKLLTEARLCKMALGSWATRHHQGNPIPKKKSRVGCVSSEVYAGISLYLRDKLFLPLLFQEKTTKNERHLLLWSKIKIPIILAVVNC
jgi:hypothetical protein